MHRVVAERAVIRGAELHDAWSRFFGRIPWELHVTLTLDSKRTGDVDRALVVKEARWWCGQVARLARRPLAWLIAPERGPGGQWHAHVLLVGLSPMGLGPAPVPMWRQRNGYVHSNA